MTDAADRDALLAWLREELDESVGSVLGQGYQASVRCVETPYGTCVVKQAHPHLLLGRLVGASVAREAEIYRRLAGVPGVPQCYGLIDRRTLVLEFVSGASLRDRQHELEDRDAFFADLLATIEAMHAAGIAHGDLKRKDNILVGPGEQPYIIDFGIAGIHRDGPIDRLWFDWFRQVDLNAWVKLKHGRRPTALTAGEQSLYREIWVERLFRRCRALWRRLLKTD